MATTRTPKDTNQLAKYVLDVTTGEVENKKQAETKNSAAVALGRLGGLVGGKARANSLTPEQRKEIAQKAAAKRWNKKD